MAGLRDVVGRQGVRRLPEPVGDPWGTRGVHGVPWSGAHVASRLGDLGPITDASRVRSSRPAARLRVRRGSAWLCVALWGAAGRGGRCLVGFGGTEWT